jgi:hypothetical protein
MGSTQPSILWVPARICTGKTADNIKMDLRETGWDGMNWIDLGQGSVDGSCEHGNELSGSIKCWEILK